MLAAVLAVLLPSGHAAAAQGGPGRWVSSWTTPVTTVPASDTTAFADQTLRQVVRASLGGDTLRVRLSNEFGAAPLVVGEASVALRPAGERGARVQPGTVRPLTFGGAPSLTVPAGAPAVSDPVALRVPEGAELVISLHLPQPTPGTSVNNFAAQTGYLLDGNAVAETDPAVAGTFERWYFLSDIAVTAGPRASAVVALGDSITAGTTLDANHRWTDYLNDRLAEAPGRRTVGVVNKGISGNRLLYDAHEPDNDDPEDDWIAYFGESGLRRFDRDVLAHPGVSDVILHLGVNDIGQPGTLVPESERVTSAELIAGYRQLIARAHERGVRVHGATITPFRDTPVGYFTPENERTRQEVNTWMRTSGAFDSVVDFDAALRDPEQPDRLAPRFDSGDHLHPNDAGNEAMAAAVPLGLRGDPARELG
ncbi:SGNH/GDSL hydrolase family protein [Streptomyces sp. 3MP-14]|uniref:SGNH/GDSL hydrolase family protein n=1 Tax=Streptomyces mimosae TaxID=2586635 RepID=A0A5N5ZZK1_9ACTN|nr:SGNH/GDSL hydrolase family protein [Streptomyces mimosae]KAB8179273.1 SGNH/GDSL hydrolase family protein [Streptomyces sp. 3MP-14]